MIYPLKSENRQSQNQHLSYYSVQFPPSARGHCHSYFQDRPVLFTIFFCSSITAVVVPNAKISMHQVCSVDSLFNSSTTQKRLGPKAASPPLRGSMVTRLRPCVKISTPPPPQYGERRPSNIATRVQHVSSLVDSRRTVLLPTL